MAQPTFRDAAMPPNSNAAAMQTGVASETQLALGIRFASLLALGILSLFVFYVALIATAQVIAINSGARGSELAAISMWMTSAILVLGILPIVRFVADEFPVLLERFICAKSDFRGTLILLALACLALFWL